MPNNPDRVEAVARALLGCRGFGFYLDPMEGGQVAYDISCEALSEAEAAIAAYEAHRSPDADIAGLVDDWRLPYRTQDAGGSPDSAGVVGWNWIGNLAQAERDRGAVLLEIHSTPVGNDGRVTALYRSTELLAVATTFRDPMNFAVLVRWMAPTLCSSSTDPRTYDQGRADGIREAAEVAQSQQSSILRVKAVAVNDTMRDYWGACEDEAKTIKRAILALLYQPQTEGGER